MKIIKIEQYPETFIILTLKKLPPFKYGCKVRTKILFDELKKQKIKSPYHCYSDYLVEDVEPDKNGNETWFLGS